MIFLAGALLTACSSHKQITQRSPEPTSSPDQPATDTSVPPDTSAPLPPSVGEQLGRLDALMRTATGDSLAHLQAEYDRILQEAGGGQIQTGKDDGTSSPRIGNGEYANAAATDTTGASNLRGLRPSELGYGSASRRTAAGNQQKAASSRLASRSPAPRYVSEPVPAKSSARGDAGKRMIDGLAAANAGNYSKATEELPAALSGSLSASNRNRAQYTYGHSLEKSGKLAKAAESYQKVARDDRQLGDKSYVSYCRVLAESGERSRAKQLLINFIAVHPKSPEVVSARRLLQTL